ncbi:hypothetical protein [Aestuariicoccus sp. MJ-SS9]|uniref:2-keto-4-pentenoate hydratase n=1 Tax=Aestuariicoccus sp. MJ-SS9 TaxID=3079855 RepID=UPI00290DC06B|nr:hypothetical protein [Aestuariicoccus sp. MJ-SS9]MDU8912009.1 hypothetical protein [Aestuariicoccus sp. MJ-SS9]
MRIDEAAEALLAAWDGKRQIAPLSDGAGITLDEGYAIAARIAAMRQARGERTLGRKIGFTNRTIWPIYNVSATVWGWMWEGGLHDIPEDGRIALPDRPELRLEPEIVFGFARSPASGMDAAALLGCLDWVAHGVELVTSASAYPGWRFTAPDTAAAHGMHAALWIGPRRPATAFDVAGLEDFALTLTGPDRTLRGEARDVLGDPLHALAHLVGLLTRHPAAGPIRPGEVVTTGTLTDAVPVARGQRWQTRLDGIALPGLDLTLV